jgi:outer membrane protein assembly factor BamB
MKSLTLSWILAWTLASLAQAAGSPAPWPQFRGPGGSGVAEDQTPPIELGPDKNVKWKVLTPSGLSSPIVVGDKLILTAYDNGKLYTIAYSRTDGSEAWRSQAPYKQLEKFNKTEGSPAASTAATDGEHIVSYFGSCGLFCYDVNGKELWRQEMPAAASLGEFGSGTSPIIVGNTVILLRDEAADAKIMALSVATGKPKWETKRQSKGGYGTPVAWETAGGMQVAAPGFGRLIGYDFQSGAEKWFIEGMPSACCTTPVIAGGELFFAGWSPGGPDDKDFKMPSYDEMLKSADADKDGRLSKAESETTPFGNFFDNQDLNKDGRLDRNEWEQIEKFMSASRSSAFALKPGGSGDITNSHIRWKQTRGLPYVSSAILYRGQYIMAKDGGILTAYDAKTGAKLFEKRALATGSYYASPVAAGGRIYFASLQNGEITVLEAGAAPPKVLAKNPPLGERLAATPAIADDTLYVRTAGNLFAFVKQ